MKQMSSLFSIFKRLTVAILCLCAINSVVACEDYAQDLKSVYGYTVIRHKVKESNIAAIEQALEKHEWQRSQNLTKDEAKAEWESFMSDINDEEVKIADGGYVTVRFHELTPTIIDDLTHWVEGNSVGEKTWK